MNQLSAEERRKKQIQSYLFLYGSRREAEARAGAAESFWEAWDASPCEDISLMFVFFDGWPVFILRSKNQDNDRQVEVRFDDIGAEVIAGRNARDRSATSRMSDVQCVASIPQLRAWFSRADL